MHDDLLIDGLKNDAKAQNWRQLYDIMADHIGRELGNIKAPLNSGKLCKALIDEQGGKDAAVGNGVAIPHLTLEGIRRPVLLFTRLTNPVDFNADDGRNIDLVFLLLSPENESHKHLPRLYRVSRLARDEHFCECLRKVGDSESLHELINHPLQDVAA